MAIWCWQIHGSRVYFWTRRYGHRWQQQWQRRSSRWRGWWAVLQYARWYTVVVYLSKYFRSKPSSGASHHVACNPSVQVSLTDLVFPQTWRKCSKLPYSIHDVIPANSQRKAILTNCRQELMHGQLFDHDFVQSYRHGFIMECLDGIWRKFYLQIFTYSADYPGK